MENKNIQVSKEELDLLISSMTQTIDYWENLSNAEEVDDFYFADDQKTFNMMNDLRKKLVDYR
ncbi:MAG: hypothetical protein PHI41_09720 [Erysipelotrichaceae bacterium]|nr:hypothetical protein [Erysipelotrichaceae bacterium]MDD3809466.1 hypothetical protein [Erysipelotrichaceae bacterium]